MLDLHVRDAQSKTNGRPARGDHRGERSLEGAGAQDLHTATIEGPKIRVSLGMSVPEHAGMPLHYVLTVLRPVQRCLTVAQ